jgi:hypothetical protein
MVTLCLKKLERLGKTTGGYRMLNTVRGAVNIIYWWIPYAGVHQLFMLTAIFTVLSIRFLQ